jgi:hypothetical protein
MEAEGKKDMISQSIPEITKSVFMVHLLYSHPFKELVMSYPLSRFEPVHFSPIESQVHVLLF